MLKSDTSLKLAGTKLVGDCAASLSAPSPAFNLNPATGRRDVFGRNQVTPEPALQVRGRDKQQLIPNSAADP